MGEQLGPLQRVKARNKRIYNVEVGGGAVAYEEE